MSSFHAVKVEIGKIVPHFPQRLSWQLRVQAVLNVLYPFAGIDTLRFLHFQSFLRNSLTERNESLFWKRTLS
jgi:hypothetical protein